MPDPSLLILAFLLIVMTFCLGLFFGQKRSRQEDYTEGYQQGFIDALDPKSKRK